MKTQWKFCRWAVIVVSFYVGIGNREVQGAPYFWPWMMGIMMSSHAVSSSSSPCAWGPHGCHEEQQALLIKKFLEESMANLEQEAAQGGGTHLEAWGQLMGCPTKSYPAFALEIQRHYRVLFNETQPLTLPQRSQTVFSQVENILLKDPSLSDCFLEGS
ncbi:DUF3015 family protein [Deltaproteobacteria bacterium TL4]